jgi:hypothetical protein
MTQPPRPPAQSVLGDSLWKRILRIAVLLAGVSLSAGVWAQHRGAEWQTMIFVTLGFSQLGVGTGAAGTAKDVEQPVFDCRGSCGRAPAAGWRIRTVPGRRTRDGTAARHGPSRSRRLVGCQIYRHPSRPSCASAVRLAAPSVCLSHRVSGSVLPRQRDDVPVARVMVTVQSLRMRSLLWSTHSRQWARQSSAPKPQGRARGQPERRQGGRQRG